MTANKTTGNVDVSTPPPTVADLKAGARARHDLAVKALAEARAERDALNERIAELRADEVDARRMMRASQPRKPKTAQPKAGKT